MADIEEYVKETFNDIADIINYAKEFKFNVSKKCNNEFEWKTDQIIKTYESLFDRFCPFKIDDRVELVKDIDITKAPEWKGCAHFLKKGEKATVKNRGYYTDKNEFCFDVMFDNESYIDNNGDKNPIPDKDKHTFFLLESHLVKEDKIIPEDDQNKKLVYSNDEYGDKLVKLGNLLKDTNSRFEDIIKASYDAGLICTVEISPDSTQSIDIHHDQKGE